MSVLAQTAFSLAIEQSLYWIALKASILEMDKYAAHIKDVTDYRCVVVEKGPTITDGRPA